MIQHIVIDRELRKIPAGTTSQVYGVPVTKVICDSPGNASGKMYKYAVNGADKPVRIGLAVKRLFDILIDHDGDE